MTEQLIYPIQSGQKTLLTNEQYLAMYEQSIAEPESFWAQQAQRIQWQTPFTKVKDVSYAKEDLHIRWFEDGELNVTQSCVDRHVQTNPEATAFVWEPDEEGAQSRIISYKQLSQELNKLSNGLKHLGVKKGDVVTIYMPMVPEAAIAMLACARIGAVHSVVFGGFSPEALAGRIEDGNSHFVITANQGLRAGKTVALKDNVDKAIELCPKDLVKHVVMLQHTQESAPMFEPRDVDYKSLIHAQSDVCEPEKMNAEDPLFILYTSGSTGKPKGVLHTCGGYLVYAAMTHEYIFDYKQGDIYWCAADVGWITGHSYIVYGPLCNGATVVMYEGVPTHPDCGRIARMIDKYAINILYIAPTAIRALMSEGDEPVKGASLSSLRLLGTVGEPINPEAWRWYYRTFGRSQCPIVDTWWQTETGAALITPLPGAKAFKPGSAARPFFGIQPALFDENGKELEGGSRGY